MIKKLSPLIILSVGLFIYGMMSYFLTRSIQLGNGSFQVAYIGIFFVTLIFAFIFGWISIQYSKSDKEWWGNFYQGTSNALLFTIFLGILIVFTVDPVKNQVEISNQCDESLTRVSSPINNIAFTALDYLNKNCLLLNGEEPHDGLSHLLSNFNLIGANLSFGEFTGLDLSRTHFNFAILGGSQFSSANLHEAEFQGADLTDSTLFRADITNGILTHADLSGADLRFADLTEAQMRAVQMLGSDFSDSILIEANLTRANLTGAAGLRTNLTRSVLRNAVLETVDLTLARLEGADLTNAVFRNANLDGVDLRGAILTNADFTGASMEGALISDDTQFSDNTLLPDGSAYREDIDLKELFRILSEDN